MKTTIVSRFVEVSDLIEAYIGNKLKKLEKYLDCEDEVKVVMSSSKNRYRMEITILGLHIPIIKSEEETDDLYFTTDIVFEKIYKRLTRYKSKIKSRMQYNIKNEKSYLIEDKLDKDMVIERNKKFNMKPMSPEEAIMQMELIGHRFYMFRNQESYKINVVYVRKNGGYGLIEQG